MSSMDDMMKKLSGEWNAEDDGAEPDTAIEQFMLLLTNVRRLLGAMEMEPAEILCNTEILSALGYGGAEGSGFEPEVMFGFFICVLLVEIERRDNGS